MARARNIKPGFFINELLAELSAETRLLFIGLWCLADREGRLEDRPKRIKGNLFPYDSFDIDPMLNQLQSNNFVTRYEVDGVRFIQIENFVKHQDPHYREKASEIPPKPGSSNEIVATNVTRSQRARILERDGYKCQQCGSEDQPCIDHIIPVSRGGDSSDDNLQVLCLPCNTKKGNKVDSTSNRPSSKEVVTSPLIPDSLIPDSPISDSLIPDSSNSGGNSNVVGAQQAVRPAKGHQLPKDWLLPKSWGEWALDDRPDMTADDVRLVAEKFRDHWHANANQRTGKKSDWYAAWRNFVRGEKIIKPDKPGFNTVQNERLDMANKHFGRDSGEKRGQVIDITSFGKAEADGTGDAGTCAVIREPVLCEVAGDKPG